MFDSKEKQQTWWESKGDDMQQRLQGGNESVMPQPQGMCSWPSGHMDDTWTTHGQCDLTSLLAALTDRHSASRPPPPPFPCVFVFQTHFSVQLRLVWRNRDISVSINTAATQSSDSDFNSPESPYFADGQDVVQNRTFELQANDSEASADVKMECDGPGE